MRRASVLVLVVGLVLLAAACGDPSAEADVVKTALGRTMDAGSMRAEIHSVIEVQGGPSGKFLMQGTGEFDLGAGRSSMTANISVPPGSNGSLGVSMLEGKFDMVLDGTMMYMRWPSMFRSLPGGADWISMDMVEVAEEAGLDLGSLGLGQDPMQGLEQLTGARDVRRVGTEEVRGVETTHYSFVVDLELYAEEVPEARPTIERLIEMMGASEIPGEIWVADDSTIRRQSMEQRMKLPDGSGETVSTTVMEYYDFGAPMDVKIPPPSKTIDLRDMAGGGP